MRPWVFTSNDRGQMTLVRDLLAAEGIAAELGEFSAAPELAGEHAVLVDPEDYDKAKKIVAAFCRERNRFEIDRRCRRRGFAFLRPLLLSLALVAALKVVLDAFGGGMGYLASFQIWTGIAAPIWFVWYLAVRRSHGDHG